MTRTDQLCLKLYNPAHYRAVVHVFEGLFCGTQHEKVWSMESLNCFAPLKASALICGITLKSAYRLNSSLSEQCNQLVLRDLERQEAEDLQQTSCFWNSHLLKEQRPNTLAFRPHGKAHVFIHVFPAEKSCSS